MLCAGGRPGRTKHVFFENITREDDTCSVMEEEWGGPHVLGGGKRTEENPYVKFYWYG